MLADGYASHLEDVSQAGASRQASGNARFFLRKSCFSLPGQSSKFKSSHAVAAAASSKRLVRKTLSMPGGTRRDFGMTPSVRGGQGQTFAVVSENGNTVLDPGVAGEASSRNRGVMTRPKILVTPRAVEGDKSNILS